jgi:two-component system, OmpR family, KDP operon response regulator KdpE
VNTPEILVIEDDDRMRSVLRTALVAERYSVQEASTVAGAVLLATQRFFDVILLDLGLPDGNGIQVIHKVRETKLGVPIIVLSASRNERDKIKALDAGADDFINKPVGMGELRARVRVALRRGARAAGRAPLSIYRTGEIEVDLNKRHVEIAGNEIHLTRIEYKLLEVLIGHADQIVSHGLLLNEVWGPDHGAEIHYLRLYILQLRRKLEADPSHPRYLLTESGVGYRLATQHFPEAWKQKLTAVYP